MENTFNPVNTTEKLTSENYPYGYTLRTTKYDWLEYKAGKGFRHVSQTINPKNSKLNKPKASVYSDVMLLGRDEKGHVVSVTHSLNGSESMNKFFSWMEGHGQFFTDDEKKSIAITCIAMSKVDAKANVMYCGTPWEDVQQFYATPVQVLCQIAKGEHFNFSAATFDTDSIKARRPANYNPFPI